MIESYFKQHQLNYPDEYLRLLNDFIQLFLKKNQELNLTRVHSDEEFVIKHLIDSLWVDHFIDFKPNQKVADLGAGGGFPGLPLAIVNPDISFTLIDSVQKKMVAVNEFAKQLKLSNVTTLSDRLEVIGRNSDYREQFDVIVSRALAPLPTLLELAIPLLNRQGEFIAMKGPGYLEEIHTAQHAMDVLNVALPTVERYELSGQGYRYLLRFKKTKGVPHLYPRRVGVPKKSPL